MKYLLEAPDDEMVEWKAAARAAGVSFAEWLRVAARGLLVGDVRAEPEPEPEPEPAAKVEPKSRVVGRSKAAPVKCPNEWAHRAGSFCKTCGRVP